VDITPLKIHRKPFAARQNSLLLVVATYLVPLGMTILFWVSQDSSHWAGGPVPLENRIWIALWNASGPFAWALTEGGLGRAEILGTFAAVWLAWLIVVLATRLRRLSYASHSFASLLWCASGLPPATLVIT
jgi:hypothetical protein